MKYKKLEYEYRREQRRAACEFQRKEFNDIGNSQDLDNEKFWRLFHNKARGKNKKKEKMSLKIDGEFFMDSQKLADLWANYFETLLRISTNCTTPPNFPLSIGAKMRMTPPTSIHVL